MTTPETDRPTAPSRQTATPSAAAPDDRADTAIRRATIAAVIAVALIAAFVSYRHVRGVALTYGEDHLNATVIPLSVDGLIVVASMTMLADSRAGRSRHWLSYLLLTLGSTASLAANVLHAQPTTPARIVAAWPSAALIGSYELLMRQIRAPAAAAPETASERGIKTIASPPTPIPPVVPEPETPDTVRGRWIPTKKEQLRLLLAEQVDPDDTRTVYALARDLAPLIRLHPGTARRYLPGLLAERQTVAGAGGQSTAALGKTGLSADDDARTRASR